MKQKTKELLNAFEQSHDEEVQLSERYKVFEKYIKQTVSGAGTVGDNGYLTLWDKSELEELNYEYEVHEFLHDIILIGSDGGDTAYGIDANGRYIEVPFIGMADEEAVVIAEDFDGFIKYVWSKEW